MSEIEVRPITSAIGADVLGLDLRRPLEKPECDTLASALREHLLLVFRDQPLSPAELVAFGEALGELAQHPFAPVHPEYPGMVVLDQQHPVGEGGDAWHADATFTSAPPGVGILQPVQLPSLGGDTCFASMVAAYEALSPPVQALLEKLQGIHDLTSQLRLAIDNGSTDLDLREMQERWPPYAHPAVITQPLSERKGLFVNSNYTIRLEGLREEESRRLLAFLREHVRSPEFQIRLHWELGTIVVWDNRFVQHFAVPDYQERRVMHRLNLEGGPPA